jgi:hypothetical protein
VRACPNAVALASYLLLIGVNATAGLDLSVSVVPNALPIAAACRGYEFGRLTKVGSFAVNRIWSFVALARLLRDALRQIDR